MILYRVRKLAPNSSHLTRGLVKSVTGRGYFRAVPYQNGDKYVTSPPPQPLNLSLGKANASSPEGLGCMVITYSKGEDQLDKVPNPARGQLADGKNIF